MLFFFFKQKTAYEMRISDWSSDVCSSDLGAVERMDEARRLFLAGWPIPRIHAPGLEIAADRDRGNFAIGVLAGQPDFEVIGLLRAKADIAIGRASCRERVCQYV